MTESKTADLALEREILARSIDQAPEAMFFMDGHGTIIYTNDAFCELVGYSREDILGQSLDLLRSDRQPDDLIEEILSTLKTGNLWGGNIIAEKKDGELFQKAWVISPVRAESGAGIWYRANAQEITTDAQMESQIRQSQKMEAIGQLASGIAHEINTPTQYIGDNLQFFQESFGGINQLLKKCEELIGAVESGADTKTIVQEIRTFSEEVDLEFLVEETPGAIERALEGNHRVAEVVRAMKEFAHPSAEEMTPTDINRAIRNTISVARNEWKYVADIDSQLSEKMPPVTCLPGAMNQVFLNMLVNAAHAIADVVGESGEKGTVTIATSLDSNWAVIRVSDTGCGIPAENVDRIFNPFFTTKDIGKGTGQGLAIAHAVVVDTHGGKLDVESEVGKGTTFTIRIPLHGPDSAEATG